MLFRSAPASAQVPAVEPPAVEAPVVGAPASAAPVGDAQGEVAITQAGPGPTTAVEVDKVAPGVTQETEPVPVIPMLSAVALLIGVTLVALRYAGRRAVSRA